MRRWHLGSMALAVAIAASPALAGPGPDEITAALEQVWAAGDFQRDLPDPPPPEFRPPPLPGSGGNFLAGLMPVLRVLAWIAVIVVAVVVALPALRWLRDRLAAARGGSEAPLAEAAAAATETAAPVREDMPYPADRLAAEGRIAEAVHALLLASIRALTGRTAVDLKAALTSREIVQTALTEPARRHAFATIARAVEISRFGGRPLGPETYQACRSSYLALAEAPGGG